MICKQEARGGIGWPQKGIDASFVGTCNISDSSRHWGSISINASVNSVLNDGWFLAVAVPGLIGTVWGLF